MDYPGPALHSQFYVLLQQDDNTVADKLRGLLNKGFDIHHVYNDETTALHMASEFGNESLVNSLLQCSPRTKEDILRADKRDNNTALHLAAIGGNVAVLRSLLEVLRVKSVDLFNKQGQTPLHFAMGKGWVDAARLLMEYGADLHMGDETGATSLHFAARGGSTLALDLVEEMTVGVLNVNQCSKAGLTALHYASWNGKLEAVEWLLARGADLSIEDKLEQAMPLHWAATAKADSVVRKLVEAHISRGVSVFRKNKAEKNVFQLLEDGGINRVRSVLKVIDTKGLLDPLASFPELSLVKLVIEYGDTGMNQKLARTLRYAAERRSDGMRVRDLLRSSFLEWAADTGNAECLNPVIKLVKDYLPNMVDSHFEKALQSALLKGKKDFAMALARHESCKKNELHKWIMGMKLMQNDNVERTKQSMEECKVSSEFIPDEIPFAYWIFEADRHDIADFIKDNKIWAKVVNEQGKRTKRTALHWAAILQKKEIVSKLCNIKECRTNLYDAFGRPPYWYAVEQKREDIQKELTGREDVRAYLDILYRDRQMFVDALNAILVGAALIASITFGGFLQPPLGYSMKISPGNEGSDLGYVAIRKSGVKVFWVFNSLSFFFSMASALAGARGVLPMPDIYIQEVVGRIRKALLVASTMLVLSIAFVLLSFGAVGFAVLPPSLKYEKDMILTSSVGGALCLVMLTWFMTGLCLLLPPRIIQSAKKAPELASDIAHTVCCIKERPPGQEDGSPAISLPPSARASTKYDIGPNYSDYPWDDGLDEVFKELSRQSLSRC